MKIARISYANTEPFFYGWDNSPDARAFEYQLGAPKQLAEAAHRGEVIAGPLPIVECWALEADFAPLGSWSIAARERCRSVYVLSKVPFSELDHVTIGATKDSATSVMLCETLIREKYGNDARIRRGLQMEDAAWLVIGDQAMQLVASPLVREWPYVTDLATEWWNWKKLPFVFARWVVRRDTLPEVQSRLNSLIRASLDASKKNLPAITTAVATRTKLSPVFLESYFTEMMYEMDADAHASEKLFRHLTKEGFAHGARTPVAH